MARTIEELEKDIDETSKVIANLPADNPAFKNARKTLEGNIERFKKRISDIRNNTVKLGDGKPAMVGTEVFGYELPKPDVTDGHPTGYRIIKRKVAGTKKVADKPGILYFGVPTEKYQHLPKYEATRFFSTESGAKGDAVLQMKLGVERSEAEMNKAKAMFDFVSTAKIEVSDLTKETDKAVKAPAHAEGN